MDRRSGELDGQIASRRSAAIRSRNRGDFERSRCRRASRNSRRSGTASGPESPIARGAIMIGPNLSDWALKRRSFIIFAMVAITIAGVVSYFRLGRNEDPPFAFRTMIVQAA